MQRSSEEAEVKPGHNFLPAQQRAKLRGVCRLERVTQNLLRGTSQRHCRVTNDSQCAVSALEAEWNKMMSVKLIYSSCIQSFDKAVRAEFFPRTPQSWESALRSHKSVQWSSECCYIRDTWTTHISNQFGQTEKIWNPPKTPVCNISHVNSRCRIKWEAHPLSSSQVTGRTCF